MLDIEHSVSHNLRLHIEVRLEKGLTIIGDRYSGVTSVIVCGEEITFDNSDELCTKLALEQLQPIVQQNSSEDTEVIITYTDRHTTSDRFITTDLKATIDFALSVSRLVKKDYRFIGE